MKKIIALFLITTLLIAFVTGCSETKDDKDKNNNLPLIVTTVFPFYDFAKNIVGDKCDLRLLVEPGKSTHDLSSNITIQQLSLINKSDIFIYCGGETDEFLEDSNAFDGRDLSKNIRAMDLVEVFEEEIIEGMQDNDDHDHEDHDEHNKNEANEKEFDEHIWTNPLNAIKISEKIFEKISSCDPENTDYYKKNFEEYNKKLTELDSKFNQTISNSKTKTIVVADRFPFRYLTERYGIDYYAAFPGCSNSTDASLGTIAFLVEKVKQSNLPAIFYVDGSNQQICKQISNETGVKMLLLHSCHDLTKQEFDSGENYISIMENNLKNLAEALN